MVSFNKEVCRNAASNAAHSISNGVVGAAQSANHYAKLAGKSVVPAVKSALPTAIALVASSVIPAIAITAGMSSLKPAKDKLNPVIFIGVSVIIAAYSLVTTTLYLAMSRLMASGNRSATPAEQKTAQVAEKQFETSKPAVPAVNAQKV